MKWLLCLYPPAWQRRFRKEVELHLKESGASGIRTALDLMAGAVDAWRNPGSIPEPEGATKMRVLVPGTCSAAISRGDAVKHALATIGITLGLVISCLVIDQVFGEFAPVKALMLSSWMIAFMFASRWTHLKVYSPAAQNVIALVVSGVVYVIILSGLLIAAMT